MRRRIEDLDAGGGIIVDGQWGMSLKTAGLPPDTQISSLIDDGPSLIHHDKCFGPSERVLHTFKLEGVESGLKHANMLGIRIC